MLKNSFQFRVMVTFAFFLSFGLMFSVNAWSLGRPFSYAYTNDDLSGWPAMNAIDGNMNTAYSSNYFTTNQNTRGVWLQAYANAQVTVGQLVLGARMSNGVPIAFPLSYDIHITDPTNSFWMDLGIYNAQPNTQGFAVVNLPAAYQTWGVVITPVTLGVDNYGNHYFQMAEVTYNPTSGNANFFSQISTNFVNTYNQIVQPNDVGGLLYSGKPNTPLPVIAPPSLGQAPQNLASGHWTTSGGGAGFTMNTGASLWSSTASLVDVNPQYYPSVQPFPFRAPNKGIQFSMDMALYYLWINNTDHGAATAHGLIYLWMQDNATNQKFWIGANLFDVRGQQPSPYYEQYDPGTAEPNITQDLSFRGTNFLTPLPGSSLIAYGASPNLNFYGFTISESQFQNVLNEVNALAKSNGHKPYSSSPADYSIFGYVFNCEVNRVQPNNSIVGVMSLEMNNTAIDMLH